jgi:hypothetical protein
VVPGFATQFCDVEVDPETGKVKILRFVAAQDVGRAIHPGYVEGQVQGGVTQGIGWAPHQGAQFAAGKRLPRIGAEVRHHQQSGRVARRHHQCQQAGRNGRQPHADEPFDESGEQERPECKPGE